jgi:hypothetical protein
MKLLHRFILTLGLIILPLMVFATSQVHAASQAITMTPTTSSPVINPGGTYKNSFQVINQGQGTYAFQVYTAPYHVSGEDYTPDFSPVPNELPVNNWFSLSNSGSQIDPGQSAKINYTIAVPPKTVPGGYYAVIFAQTQFPKTANSITLNERVGEIFYIEVAGPVTQKGAILAWSSPLLQKPPLSATLRLEDTGGLYYPATIHIKVKDLFGNTKYSLLTIKEVLPQTIRRIDINWTKAPSLGLFKVTGTVSFLNRNHVLATQWVLVMSQSVRLGFIIGFVILLIIIVLRAFRHRKVKLHKKSKK